MKDFTTYLSTAPVVALVWFIFTAGLLIEINRFFPDPLVFSFQDFKILKSKRWLFFSELFLPDRRPGRKSSVEAPVFFVVILLFKDVALKTLHCCYLLATHLRQAKLEDAKLGQDELNFASIKSCKKKRLFRLTPFCLCLPARLAFPPVACVASKAHFGFPKGGSAAEGQLAKNLEGFLIVLFFQKKHDFEQL